MTTIPDLQTLYNHEYVVYDEDGRRIKVLCRACGDVIADSVQVGEMRDPNTGLMVPRMVFKNLPNNAKVQMLLSNGLEMHSVMCTRCAKHLSKAELNAVYHSEIQAIERDGVIHDKLPDAMRIVDGLLALTVTRRIN